MRSELPRAKLEISFWALAILVFPLLVLTASALLLGIWGDSGLTVGAEVLTGAPLVELASRYLVFAAFFFFVTTSVAVTAILLSICGRDFPGGRRSGRQLRCWQLLPPHSYFRS